MKEVKELKRTGWFQLVGNVGANPIFDSQLPRPVFDRFQIILKFSAKFYRKRRSFFREIIAKSIFFFIEGSLSLRKNILLRFYTRFSRVDCNVEKERNGEKITVRRYRGKNNSSSRKGTLKKRKKIKRPVALVRRFE